MRRAFKWAIRLGCRTLCGWPHSSSRAAQRRWPGRCAESEVVAFGSGTVRDRLESGDLSAAAGDAFPLAEVTLIAPVPRPRAIFGIGRNYAAHAAELGNELPKQPMVFMKLPTSSVPPAGPVRCPAIVEQLDYEAELAVVMGADGSIAGWAVADDVSARDLQDAEDQWTRAKGFDTSCPWGPWITTVDELPDARGLRIGSWVNGEQRQDSTTSDSSSARRSSSTSSPRPARSSRAT